MARIPDSFLEDLRARLKPSEVVSRHMKLKRRSGGEYVAIDDESFTVSDAKNLIHDFGRTHFDGDIVAFEMHATGCTFRAAVETLASIAGLQVPGADDRRGEPRQRAADRHHATNGGAGPPVARSDPRPGLDHDRRVPGQRRRNIAATFGYRDADGALIYEVIRWQWRLPDGSWELAQTGKPKKTFSQRQPAPGEPGRWVWGLDAGEYRRRRPGEDWLKSTDDRADWPEQLVLNEPVPHGLYRLPELLDERAQPPDERRPVFLPEGEAKSDLLAGWGCVATTNSGGAAHWTKHHAEMLRGLDVVVLADNDKAGREGAHKRALMLRGVAARVRVLDFRAFWPGCPDKGDVVDWRDHAGGTAEKLFEIVDGLPDWTPEPPESKFRAIRWEDLDRPGKELEPLIKNVLTRGEVSMWYGAPSSGKTFLIIDACMSVARGVSWFGNRVEQGLVIYQAGEKYLGIKRRLRAYRKHHRITERMPLLLIPARINLWVDDKHTKEMIEEVNAWAAYYEESLELIFIDTFSAAAVGANENASEDVGRVLQRCHDIAAATGAHVALVHHIPKTGGSPRGWSGMTGNVETLVEILETDQQETGFAESGATVKRTVRNFVTRKQSDGEAQLSWSFVLHAVEVGRDPVDGAPITSCVVLPSTAQKEADRRRNFVPPNYYDLSPGGRSPNNVAIFNILCRAIGEMGRAPDATDKVTGVPAGLGAIKVEEWRAAAERAKRGTEATDAKTADSVRQAVKRAIDKWTAAGVIGVDNGWVWRTTRKVAGVDPPPPPERARASEPDPLLAAGETVDDIIGSFE